VDEDDSIRVALLIITRREHESAVETDRAEHDRNTETPRRKHAGDAVEGWRGADLVEPEDKWVHRVSVKTCPDRIEGRAVARYRSCFDTSARTDVTLSNS